MGLPLLGHPELAATNVGPGYELAPAPPSNPDIDQNSAYDTHLDAMGGKNGNGKGKGDGKCHTCGGDGHFSRECPSTAPVGPQALECLGCNGRGHVRAQRPTANPHLKGKGERVGGKGWDSGKGWGGKTGGKGWGGKGKGEGGKGYGWVFPCPFLPSVMRCQRHHRSVFVWLPNSGIRRAYLFDVCTVDLTLVLHQRARPVRQGTTMVS